MKHIAALSLLVLTAAALGACDRPSGLFADRSIPIAVQPASADGAPRYVGEWARSTNQCEHPWVIKARSIQAGGSDCDFDKVESSSAGYAVAAVCHAPGGLNPVRLIIVTPNQAQISSLTISGGPFTDAVSLERCSGPQ
jgi:hypothetical protein